MSARATPEAPSASPGRLRHTPLEDAIAFVSAAVLVALGVALFEAAGLMTGGVAGLALLISYETPLGFGPAFVLVNLPFFVLAIRRMGWRFTLKTAAAVLLLAIFSELQRPWLRLQSVDPIYGAAVGGLLVGVGLLILIRHRGSLGGFGILALYLQDRLGFRAGWVQLALDAGVLTLSLLSIPPVIVAISLIGALTLNLTLANNHRPGRYVGM
jgi:uncharacterized membrane-anchored protein YitT (DUF2179 family)